MSKGRKNGNQSNKGANGGKPSGPTEKCLFKRPDVQAIRIEPTSEDNKRYSSEETYRNDQLGLSLGLNIITAVGAAISVITLVALFISLHFNRQATQAAISQAKTSQQEFEISQRPWLSTADYQVGPLQIMKDSASMQMGFSMTNVGHSVAKNVSFAAILVPNDRDGGRNCQSIAKEVRQNATTLNTGYTIFPNQPGRFIWVAYANPTQMQEAREHPLVTGDPRKMTFRLIACLSYTSVVDQSPHYTKTVFILKPRGTGGFFDIDSPIQNVELVMDINGTDAT